MNDFLTKRLITDTPTRVGVEASSTVTPAIDIIPFVLDSKSLKHIKDATTEFAKHVGKYQVHYVSYERYGKEGIKKMKTSPDGWSVERFSFLVPAVLQDRWLTSYGTIRTQQVFQLAYRMTHDAPCGTYEAAQVRKFQLGRTETVRICTEESVAWTTAMLDGGKTSNKQRRDLFRAAVGVHGVDMKNASNGMGIDRHLFGQF